MGMYKTKMSFFALLLAVTTAQVYAQGASGFKLVNTYKIASSGGWDYIALHSGRIYVSHGTQVNILDQQSGDSLGVIPGTTGVHGIAFVESLGKGYTSNGRLNNITVFDLKTNAVLKQIPVGENPDAIMYEEFTKKLITCNGRSHDLSIVDPVTESVVTTIPLSGKPETAVSDGAGKLYVNIEDKNLISVVDLKTNAVLNSWPIAPGEGPTGLAIDVKTKRLFAGCDKLLMVLDAGDGHVVAKVPIGDGCDGVAFDDGLKYIFASCGEGKLSIVEEVSANQFNSKDDVATQRGARTITIDKEKHQVFMPTASFGTAVAGERPQMIGGTFRVLVVSR